MNAQPSTRLRAWTLALLASTVAAGPPVHTQPGSASGAVNTLTRAEAAAGWTLLFDGRTLAGWTRATGDADWTVDHDVITYSKGRGLLWTEKAYDNYQLKLEFWAERTANTGVFLRCGPKPGPTTCYEVNIFDPHETDPTGSIVGVHSVLPERPDTAEKWNTYEITADGDHLVVKLNGNITTDVRDTVLKLAGGPIGLQAAGPGGPGVARFRNIKIRSL